MAAEKRKYPFVRVFEAGLALAMATSPRFFETVGRALDPERMPSEVAALVVKASKEIQRTVGTAPTSRDLVLQRIRSMVDDGKVTFERMKEVDALLTLAEDVGAAEDLDGLIGEAVPVVSKFAQQEAVEATIADFGKGMETSKVVDRFSGVASIGHRREVSTEVAHGTEEDIRAAVSQHVGERLPTGIMELDLLLNGGMERGALGLVMGQTGVGKSMFLSHIVSDAMFNGIDCAYVTLELSPRAVKSRVYANLLNMTAREMEADAPEAARRWAMLKASGLGRLETVYMTQGASCVADIARWLKEREREVKFRPRLLAVDMGDHLVSKVGSDKRSYDEMKVVFGAIRELAVEREGWSWTASHVKTGNAGKKKVNVDQAADSAHKSRLADVIISAAKTDDDEESALVRFGIPKRRLDEGVGGACGPLPQDCARGRMVVMSREVPWG